MNMSIYDLIVKTFTTEAHHSNQNRQTRLDEVRTVGKKIESKGGKIQHWDQILDELETALVHDYDTKRDSFGYKETAKRLKQVISEVTGH
ncbi:hypothetical protein J4H39_22905 [Vibrio alginolyticus]|uniref:Uncharacterized protein n=1 Tax=Vibrio cidicii TaxID=1763883 RepID=A0ABR5W3A3_9VIBR|nr:MULTISPECIES: hypothetical protein [Vibrio]EGQ7931502.1 hypothetical protein [Vibrio vulnificus]EGQ8102156.1 hypothetical protein [Vibrio parahaemolyticus]EGQ8307581.1 hypothetical protein [Vibrio parahaemolyticus]EGQ9289857.1 hypothetical protein [Vibrio parahaemolyticus]EGQ9522040.1 hypothetical protein [Vibrio parahaemolyticus]